MGRPSNFDKEEALSKALRVFWQKGYESTSVDDLLRAMSINKGSLYNAFGDKHALFLEAIVFYNTQYVAKKVVELDEEPSGRRAIEEHFKALVNECLAGKRCIGCLLVNSIAELAVHDAKAAELAEQGISDVENALYRAVHRGKRAGEISSRKSARELARFFSNSINGLRLIAKTSPEPKVLRDIVKVNLSVLDA